MSPEVICALLDEWIGRDDGPLSRATRDTLKSISREGYRKVCAAVGKKTTPYCTNSSLNIVLNLEFVNQQAELVWRSEIHQVDAHQLLLNGASRDLVHEVTGLHPREITRMRERLGLSRCSVTPTPTPAEQAAVKRSWDRLDYLSDANRLIAVQSETDVSIARVWEIVRPK